MRRALRGLSAAALVCVSVGCADGAEGIWVGDQFDDKRNVLTIDSGGSGQATLFFYEDTDELLSLTYAVDWNNITGSYYELTMLCGDSCFEDNFIMACAFDDEVLDCTGSHSWSEYTFVWQREN